MRRAGNRAAPGPGSVVRAAATLGATLAIVIGVTGCSSSSPEPVPSPTSTQAGSADCDAGLITSAVKDDFDANYPGSTFVSLDAFTCEGGWALAEAQFEASGATFPTVVVLRADGGVWAPVTIEEVCQTPLDQSDVPAAIYTAACGDE